LACIIHTTTSKIRRIKIKIKEIKTTSST